MKRFALVIVQRSEEEIDTLMPSYTHLQRAQPSRLSHHLLAWQEMLWRDRARLQDARRRTNECPLGSGAVAGSGFPLDREAVAKDLEFDGPMRNSIDATASRDFLNGIGQRFGDLGDSFVPHRRGNRIVVFKGVWLHGA